MKTLTRNLLSAALVLTLSVPSASWAQRAATGNNARTSATQRTSTSTSTARPTTSTTSSSVSSSTSNRSSALARPATSTQNTKPGGTTTRPTGNTSNNNPGNSSVRPGGSSNQPGGGAPGNAVRPGGNQPGNSGVRPGTSSAVRPGNNVGTSAKRPGTASYRPSVTRPNYNYTQPNYRPIRPGGGYYYAPPANIYRPVYYTPIVPPRYTVVRPGIPTLGNVLGLAFGTFIDASINSLYNGGYNILGYQDNAIYLSNVNELGYMWPEATVYYTDGLMSNTQFSYWTTTANASRFNSVYNTLTNMYGYPIQNNVANGVTTVSWWDGSNTAYITLQYGPGAAQTGRVYYYTTLTYSDYYY